MDKGNINRKEGKAKKGQGKTKTTIIKKRNIKK